MKVNYSKIDTKVKPYKWQKEIIEAEGNCCVKCGRQSGKSTAIAIKVGQYAIKKKNKNVLVIAAVKRQASLLFEKIKAHIEANAPKKVKRGRDKPTMTRMYMKNGTTIRCLPTGMTGAGIRGHTIDVLVADEASRIHDMVWTAVTPMLSTTDGQIVLLSTPKGRQGYFYESWVADDFRNWSVSSEEVEHISKEYLKKERRRMSKLQYAQEYLAEFIEDLKQFFPKKLIKKVCILEKEREDSDYKKYIGCDIARMGGDETAIATFDMKGDSLRQIGNKILQGRRVTRVAKELINATNKYSKVKKLYIDEGGIGAGVYDILLEHNRTKRKVIPINNAKRSLEFEDRKRRLLKEDLYHNLLRLMEQGRIKLLDKEEIKMSLNSIQFEVKDDGSMQIFGNYDHITEALVRGVWSIKDKSLNIYIK